MKSQVISRLNRGSKRRVYIGISGGVDSSVSAALLKRAGYDVTGVFIRTWQPDWLPCTWREERRDAMRVAATLDIPFVTLDLESEYKQKVADYMIAEYRAGRTPNPDVMCNKEIKFGAFYEWAIGQGADYVATGHYSQIQKAKSKKQKFTVQSSETYDSSEYQLYVGADENKDQSYFLWNIRTEQLPHILFPVGHLKKLHVRALAKKFNLPTAEKKDSQGICFLGMVDMKEFLSHYIDTSEGKVLDLQGNVIGVHPGAALFTIGERHGFTITHKGANDEPRYVVSKDVKENTITVATKREKEKGKGRSGGECHSTNDKGQKKALGKCEDATVSDIVELEETNWIGGAPVIGKKYEARGRYRQALTTIIFRYIDAGSQTATVEFTSDHEAMTPGQSLVVYDGKVCVGGGVMR